MANQVNVLASALKQLSLKPTSAPRALERLAHGQPILDAKAAVEAAGLGKDGLPRLCLAPARWREVGICLYDEGLCIGPTADAACGEEALFELRVTEEVHASAMVPVVPTEIRPSRMTKSHFILFEPTWKVAPKPRDPALLRHLRGSLFAVEATWAMTKAEADAMAFILGASRDAWSEFVASVS